MALLHRRKAFSAISRYRLCGRSFFSSFSSGTVSSEHGIPGLSSISSSSTQMQSLRQLWPALTVAMRSYLSASPCLVAPRSYCTSVATCIGGKYTTPCCYRHKCTANCGCLCTITGGLRFSARNCATTAYPPPAPPGEFQGGDAEAEDDGAPLNVDQEEGAAAMEGAEDLNMPPFDDSNYPEDDDGNYEDEDPPPDPEEKLLYSPSDED